MDFYRGPIGLVFTLFLTLSACAPTHRDGPPPSASQGPFGKAPQSGAPANNPTEQAPQSDANQAGAGGLSSDAAATDEDPRQVAVPTEKIPTNDEEAELFRTPISNPAPLDDGSLRAVSPLGISINDFLILRWKKMSPGSLPIYPSPGQVKIPTYGLRVSVVGNKYTKVVKEFLPMRLDVMKAIQAESLAHSPAALRGANPEEILISGNNELRIPGAAIIDALPDALFDLQYIDRVRFERYAQENKLALEVALMSGGKALVNLTVDLRLLPDSEQVYQARSVENKVGIEVDLNVRGYRPGTGLESELLGFDLNDRLVLSLRSLKTTVKSSWGGDPQLVVVGDLFLRDKNTTQIKDTVFQQLVSEPIVYTGTAAKDFNSAMNITGLKLLKAISQLLKSELAPPSAGPLREMYAVSGPKFRVSMRQGSGVTPDRYRARPLNTDDLLGKTVFSLAEIPRENSIVTKTIFKPDLFASFEMYWIKAADIQNFAAISRIPLGGNLVFQPTQLTPGSVGDGLFGGKPDLYMDLEWVRGEFGFGMGHTVVHSVSVSTSLDPSEPVVRVHPYELVANLMMGVPFEEQGQVGQELGAFRVSLNENDSDTDFQKNRVLGQKAIQLGEIKFEANSPAFELEGANLSGARFKLYWH